MRTQKTIFTAQPKNQTFRNQNFYLPFPPEGYNQTILPLFVIM